MHGLGNSFRKTQLKKSKNSKNKTNCRTNKKSKKHILVPMPFSYSTQKMSDKFHAAKPLDFSLKFLFRRDQDHYSNLNSKKYFKT